MRGYGWLCLERPIVVDEQTPRARLVQFCEGGLLFAQSVLAWFDDLERGIHRPSPVKPDLLRIVYG